MRKLVHAQYVSLDGVVEDPSWTGPFFNDELAALQRQALFAADALVLGRRTFEQFAAVWPTMEDADGFAARMNSMPKHVASSTPVDGWNGCGLGADPVRAVADLKRFPGGDLLVYGSQTFADALSAAGLVDEYRLMVNPVVVGSGAHVFARAGALDGFGLLGSVRTSTGVVVLTYGRSTASLGAAAAATA